jgi:hypothetical protein
MDKTPCRVLQRNPGYKGDIAAKKYRERASRGDTVEFYGCVQTLSCHISGCLKVLVYVQTYPDREATQTYSRKCKRETL